jgi:uncharacterized protein (PEP-CTERM system associated)
MSEWRIDGSARQARSVGDMRVRRRIAVSVWSMGLVASGSAHAVDWIPTATLTVGATASDNAFLAPRGRERSDIILRTTPVFGLNRDGPRLRLNGRLAPTVLGYVNDTVPDAIMNSLAATANYEVSENFAFIEGKALVAQSVLSPLGVQPVDGPTNTANRVETRTFGVSPYVQGRFSGGGSYQLRYDYSHQSFSRGGLGDTVFNRITASASDAPGTFIVLGGEYFYSNVALGSFQATTSQIGRLRASVITDPEVKLSGSVGYEDNTFGTRNVSGVVAGASLTWTPSDRTNFEMSYEKRYFGGSYNVSGQHRTRLASFRLRAYRSEQELQNRATGVTTVSTRDALDSSLLARFPDSADRAREVERLMVAGALPDTLSSAGTFLTTRVNRVEGIEPSVTFTGLRNTLLLSVFRRETTPLSTNLSTGFADAFTTAARIEQTGFGVTGTHRFTELVNGVVGVDVIRTRAIRTGAANSGTTQSSQQSMRATLSYTLSPMTTAGATLRFVTLNFSPVNDVRERAVIFTLSHTFR